MFTNKVRSIFLTTQGCLLRLNTLVALQCAENVVFIAIDNQNPHGGRIFSASTADKRKKYSPPSPLSKHVVTSAPATKQLRHEDFECPLL